jgi:hypothetical protein
MKRLFLEYLKTNAPPEPVHQFPSSFVQNAFSKEVITVQMKDKFVLKGEIITNIQKVGHLKISSQES